MTRSAIVLPFKQVPVIDVGPLIDRDGATPEALTQTVEAIADACRHVGFFYVENHGIDDGDVDAVLSESRRFFDLPLDEKNRIAMSSSAQFRGYVPMCEEVTAGKRDWHECIDLQPWSERSAKQPAPGALTRAHPLDDSDQWPAALPSFRDVMMRAWTQRYALGMKLAEGLALSLGLDARYFEPFQDHELCALRLSHYPPFDAHAATEDVELGMGAHHDNGFLAILQQDAAGGLEVLNAEGIWVAAPHIPNTFLVNLGLMMQRWTNDRYRATWHRVLLPEDKHRYAAPFFFEPGYDARIDPLAVCCDAEHPPRYEPCIFGPFLSDEFSVAYKHGATAEQ